MSISHEQQRLLWNEEHRNPFALKQMDSMKGSSCLVPFYEFLESKKVDNLVGLEMGCGKGRNVLWLAAKPLIARMYGFDFSDVAIAEANRRATEQGMTEKTELTVMDATMPWDVRSDSMDFLVDCTASTDIENPEGRHFAAKEMHRVLKTSGYVFVYTLSTDDEYHQLLITQSPTREENAFIHPQTGKFEKVFSEEELDTLYQDFRSIEKRRIAKTADFFGKRYACKHHWRIYQK